MDFQYDEKGKIFTEIIPKESVRVVVQTVTNRIVGYFHARSDNRLKDELNNIRDEQFIAITDATVLDAQGDELYRSDFLALNRSHIVWLIPIDAEEQEGAEE